MKSTGLALALVILIPTQSPAQAPPISAEKFKQEVEKSLEERRKREEAERKKREAERRKDRFGNRSDRLDDRRDRRGRWRDDPPPSFVWRRDAQAYGLRIQDLFVTERGERCERRGKRMGLRDLDLLTYKTECMFAR